MSDQLIALMETLVLGVVGLFACMYFNAFFSRRISLHYEVRARRYISRQKYNVALYFFFHAVIGLAVVQIGSIVIWATLLRVVGVVPDMTMALLFAGSCYTTVGILSDIAPEQWRLLPIFIAVSGIFSFALSTANVVGMTPLYRRAWFAKHARHVRGLLATEHLDPTEVGLAYLVEKDEAQDRRRSQE